MLRKMIIALAILPFLFTGCKEKKPTVDPNAPPPEQSVEVIYKELRETLTPIDKLAANETQLLSEIGGIVSALKSACNKHKGKNPKNAPEAISRIAEELASKARQSRDAELWAACKACCKAYVAAAEIANTNMDGTTKELDRLDRILKRAETVLARPNIMIQGFVGTGESMLVILECTDRRTGVTEDYRVRAGEEFRGEYQLTRVVGNNQGIEIKHVPTDDSWEVEGPQ
jgi:hypothetical protein